MSLQTRGLATRKHVGLQLAIQSELDSQLDGVQCDSLVTVGWQLASRSLITHSSLARNCQNVNVQLATSWIEICNLWVCNLQPIGLQLITLWLSTRNS